MGIFDNVRNWLLAPILSQMDSASRTRMETIYKARAYRVGKQPDTLKVRDQQTNDNLVINFVGLAVDRSVSLLFGKGVQFNLPGEGDTKESQYLEKVLDANKQQILLHRLALVGAEAGTCYLRYLPGMVIGKDGNYYPRLVVVDPEYVEIETDPEDIEVVWRYVIKYPVDGPDHKPALRKIKIERSSMATPMRSDAEEDQAPAASAAAPVEDTWTITESIVQESGEIATHQEVWPHDFSPLQHWQNLPSVGSPYGQPDITPDVMRLQDRINFTGANISKIIRLYAHPQRFSRMAGANSKVDIGPDQMPNFNDPNGGIFQLEPLGDIAAAVGFYEKLERALFSVTRTMDPATLEDRMGQLTNFGLRVLYQDALQKLATKRELYGDALLEMARRLLVLGGFENTDPGAVVWPDPLPENQQDVIAGLEFDLANSLVSPETVSQKRGYDWEVESKRILRHKAEQANTLAQALIERERRARENFDRNLDGGLSDD